MGGTGKRRRRMETLGASSQTTADINRVQEVWLWAALDVAVLVVSHAPMASGGDVP